MRPRPVSVTIIGCLFILAGAIGFGYHVTELDPAQPFKNDALWVCLVRALAVVCGIFVLRGRNWARWAMLAWIAYHAVLSAWHSLGQILMHALLLAVFAWFLLRPKVAAYFRGV